MMAISLMLSRCTGSVSSSTTTAMTTQAIHVATRSQVRVTPTAVAGTDGYFWLAGTYPCATGKCGALMRSGDDGRTWVRVGWLPSSGGSLVFANRSDGYLYVYNRTLYWTGDGGHAWQKVRLPATPEVPVVTSGRAYVLLTTDYRPTALASASITGNSWKVSKLPALSSHEQVAVAAYGTRVWLVLFDGSGGKVRLMVSDDAGASFAPIGGTGMGLAITCDATATSVTTLWGFCTTGLNGYPVRSSDGGRTFVRLAAPARAWTTNSDQILPVSDSVAVFQSMLGAGGWGEFVTRDRGRHFAPTLLIPVIRHPVAVGYPYVAFADGHSWLTLGVYSSESATRLWRTTNGGRSWQPVKAPSV